MAKQPFATEGMTVNEILNLSYDTLSKMSTRDLSRALRTVSLAANKRVNRLTAQARKTKEGYIPKKSARHNISLDALNAITKDGKTKAVFGVKQAKSRNQMLSQMKEIRGFMGMKTSTIKGATEVRKKAEKRLFGKTREQAARGKTKKERAAIYSRYDKNMSAVYETYRKFLEMKGLAKHAQYDDSGVVLNFIANAIASGEPPEKVLADAINKANQAYIDRIDEINEALEGADPFEFIDNDDEGF